MTSEFSPRRVVPKYNGVAAYDAAAEPRQVLRNLRQADALDVLEDDGGAWLKVRLPDGIEAFVRRDTTVDAASARTAGTVPEPGAPRAQPAAARPAMSYEVAPPPAEMSVGEHLKRTFDWSLRSFVTPLFIRWIFALGVALIGLTVVAFVLLALRQQPSAGFVALIVSPLVFLIMVFFFRMYVELAIVLFRIEENTRR